MLRDVDIKAVYESEEDNLLTDFYIPALSEATSYQRSVGYFSAATLTYAAQAFSTFIENKGHIQLIVGAFVSNEDFEAVKSGYKDKEIAEQLGKQFLKHVDEETSSIFQCRVKALAWLVAHNRLEIKIALRPNGLFHEKVGIIKDADGDCIVFTGSANETDKALLPQFNYESINAFRSWVPELEPHWRPHALKFERLWNNEYSGTAVIEFPEAAKRKLDLISEALEEKPSVEMELVAWNEFLGKPKQQPISSLPRVPEKINGTPFKIRKHQTKALNKWRANGFIGILALCTGAGKTITSIYGTVQIANKVPGLVVVIAVPYQDLADQWIEVLELFNIHAIRCYRSRHLWETRLASAVHANQTGTAKFTAIVVVNRTLKSSAFQKHFKALDPSKMLLIGDECHHHGSLSFQGFIPAKTRFRLGLSATPEHYLSEERNEHLESIYGKVVEEYSLAEAVKNEILTPYRYNVIPVELTAEESDKYRTLSAQIGRMFAAQSSSQKGSSENEPLQAKLRDRARVVASASQKITALRRILDEINRPIPHSLFYCGDGLIDTEDPEEDEIGLRQIQVVSKLLHDHGWTSSQFTARESRRQRDEILDSFKRGYRDSLVAIKCLDEGIDIPACRTAFILASSRDPRQFIQRRGRILRRSKGKDLAEIYDFLVMLPEAEDDDTGYSRRLLKGELARVAEFAGLSINRHECYNSLRPVLTRYSLEHLI